MLIYQRVDVSPMEDHHISWSNHVKSRGFLRKSSSSMRDFPASQCPLVPILSIINHYNEEPQYVYVYVYVHIYIYINL